MEVKVHDQEILLQKLWKSRKLFDEELRAQSGERVEVIYAGTENLDTGPDFKDAVVKIDGRLIKGDVEIHLDPAGWYAHGHQQDPRYNGVILHVVSQASKEALFVEREDGVQVHQLLIRSSKAKGELWKSSGSKVSTRVSIVEDCPLSTSEITKIMRTLYVAGERRLSDKAEQFREELTRASWDNLIYKKIMEALGYAKNQVPFAKLADLIPYEVVSGEMQWVTENEAKEKAAALLFGAAGLLPSGALLDKERLGRQTRDFIRPLADLWPQLAHRLEIKPMRKEAWQFFRLRPQNFPTRRIAGMVQLLSRVYREGFLNCFLKILSVSPKNYETLVKQLQTVFIVQADGFWTTHYRFDHSKSQDTTRRSALIGRERARDIIVNIILPALLLYSEESGDGKLKNTVREVYLRFPKLSSNVITKAMRSQLFAAKADVPPILSASQQQGMIQLHKNFCRPLRCSHCLDLSP